MCCGIDPSKLLRADPLERELLLNALPHAQEYQREHMTALARTVVHEYAEAVRRGRRRG